MFDWFRDIGLELGGIDSKAAKKERMEKREQKKLNRFIFTGGMKVLIIVLGVLYLFLSGSMIIALRSVDNSAPQIVKYIAMSIVDMVVIISLIFGKKKGEMIALVGVFLFVVGLFLSVVLA